MSDPVVVNIANKPVVQVSVIPGAQGVVPNVSVTSQVREVIVQVPGAVIAPPGPPVEIDFSLFSYRHRQIMPAAIWTVNHGLKFNPGGIVVLDTSNEQWLPVITYIDTDTLQLSFGGAIFAGDAYLS